MTKIHSELVSLFGEQVLTAAHNLPISSVEQQAEKVAEYAALLSKAAGQPEKQRSIIRGMTKPAAAALCKWLKEPDLILKVIHKQVSI